ncbi:MAG TPA: hypothetical protein VN461_14550 [Vicinamibacteria bacterium]|nr:hypothetical protein [Vicinamibacteria bacterium]
MVRRRYSLVGLGSTLALGSILAGCTGSTPSKATPAPTPAPTATPAPAATPSAFVCPLGPSSNPDALVNPCPVLNPRLADLVGGAIDLTIAKHPELFNLHDLAGGNPRVLDRQKYHEAVAAAIDAAGGCVLIEKEELAVKNTNDFSEQWNIYTSVGFVRRKYVTTCSPAWF